MTKSNKYAEKWQERVNQFEASGLHSASEWCRRRQVCFRSFISWRKRLKMHSKTISDQAPNNLSFVELKNSSTKESGIQIHYCKLKLVLDKDFDSSTLITCLQILEKL